METDKKTLSLSHRYVGHREGREDDRVLVGVGCGGKVMQRWLRGSHNRSGMSQDNVLRR